MPRPSRPPSPTAQSSRAELSALGTTYILCIAAIGSVALALSIQELNSLSIWGRWLPLAALTLLSGAASVKLPSVPATISVSETFVFTAVLLFGPGAGAVINALDALIITLWVSKRRHEWYRIAFNITAPAISIWLAAHLYYSFPGISPLALAKDAVAIENLMLPLAAFALAHFLINTWLVAFAISLQAGRPVTDVWRRDFPWLSLNYFGGASVAALIAVYARDVSGVLLAIIIPLLLVLYLSFKIPLARIEDSQRHVAQVNSLYLSTIETLAMAVDAKDQVTHGHIRRVQLYATSLAKELGIGDEGLLKAIEASALLHDMGKLAIPEHILNKPGKLSAAEFEKMKMHASIGADILSAIEFPYPVVPIVRHHHENWDGSGYPDGLKGTDIPIGARILAVVDCYDALTSDRPYRPALSDEKAITILLERRATMYDPLVVDTFIRVHAELSADDVKYASMPHPAFPDLHRGALRRTANQDDSAPPVDGQACTRAVTYQTAPAGLLGVDSICAHIREVGAASEYVLATYDPEGDQLVVQIASGDTVMALRGQRILLGQRSLGWVAANRRPILNSDPALDLASGVFPAGCRLTSSLVLPLCIHNDLIGVFGLYAVRPFTRVAQVQVEGSLPLLVDALRPGALRHAAAS